MGGREHLELESPLFGAFSVICTSSHGRSVAPVAAAQRITRIAPPGHAERKPLAIPPQHFSSSKNPRSRLSRGFLSGCYGSLSTIDGLHHTAGQSELFHQGGKLNHGFLTSEDVTAADTIDREIIWSCNRLRHQKSSLSLLQHPRLLIMPGRRSYPLPRYYRIKNIGCCSPYMVSYPRRCCQ